MIAASFSAMANATQEQITESVNVAVAKKLGGDNGDSDTEALRKQLKALQQKYDAAIKSGGNGGNSSGGGNGKGDNTVYDPCPKCGKRHKPRENGECWYTVDKDKAPKWWRRHHPELFPGKDE